MLQLWLMEGKRCVPLEIIDMSSLDAVTRALPSGLYTTFRTYGSRTLVLGLNDHLNRLYSPANSMGIQPTVDKPALRSQLASLLFGFPSPEARLRLVLVTQAEPGTIYVLIEPLQSPPAEVYSRGVQVITTSAFRDNPALKATDFIQTSQAERRKLAAGTSYEGLILRNGRIMEGLTSNFFYMIGETLGTARSGVLNGVTRRQVLRLAMELGMPINLRSLKLSQIPTINEAFLTSSSRGIVPIVTIDDWKVGNGRVGEWTKRLGIAYNGELERRLEVILPKEMDQPVKI